MDLREVSKLGKGLLVTQWNVDEAVVGESRHGRKGRALLTTSLGGSAEEQAGVLAPVGTGLPLASSAVPESLPLSWEIAVTGWNAEKEGIVLLECLWVGQGWDVGVLVLMRKQ